MYLVVFSFEKMSSYVITFPSAAEKKNERCADTCLRAVQGGTPFSFHPRTNRGGVLASRCNTRLSLGGRKGALAMRHGFLFETKPCTGTCRSLLTDTENGATMLPSNNGLTRAALATLGGACAHATLDSVRMMENVRNRTERLSKWQNPSTVHMEALCNAGVAKTNAVLSV